MIAGQGGNQLDTIQMDFTARRFDTFSETFTIEYYDDDGNLQEVDLTDAVVQMQLKKRKSDQGAFFSMDVAISGNEITISKNHTLMDLPAGKYWHDIEVKDSDGDHITWVQGRFQVVEHITEYVDTYVSYLWNTIKSVLQIFDVPKRIILTYLRSYLSIEDTTINRFFAIFRTAPIFSSLSFYVNKITINFRSTLGIASIPKIIFNSIFRVIVNLTSNVYYYSTGRFVSTVNFYESD